MANASNQTLGDFQRLFNLSIDMQCIASADGYFKIVNAAFTRTLGFDEGTFLSQPFITFVHPNDVDSTLLVLERLISGESLINFENRYRHKDGSYRVLNWSASAQNDLIYCLARDVTQQNETKYRFQQIQSALNTETIVAITDSKGTITEVNDLFCDISGYTRDELIGKNHRILNSGKHPKHFFTDLWQTISSGKTWSGLIENRRKNGEHYFVQSVITPIFNVQGAITNYLSIRFDITEHVYVRDELTKTLSILNETGDIAKVGGWELDLASKELTWTDQTFKILGVKKQHDQRPKLPEGLELFTPQYKPIVEKAVQRAIELGEPYDLEVQAQTPDGQILWVSTNGKANYVDGERVSVSGTIQDIHLRKTTEINYELERLKNIQNSKMASLGVLSAGIAHEINNPLAIIDGTALLMTRYLQQPDKLKLQLEKIQKSSHRIARIVKSLQKYSRSDEKQNFASFSLDQIVRESITLTEVRAKRFSVAVTFESHAKSHITCDEVEIEQVIVNLINNAIDAVKHSTSKWIKLVTTMDNNHLILSVSDSGPGVPKEMREKLFDPFFTTKEQGQGTGLGLSISKGILKEHNADITLCSDTPNTCFLIKFNKVVYNNDH